MTIPLSPTIETQLSEAIQHNLGDIDALPEPAQAKVRLVYQRFFGAYLKIAELKKSTSGTLSQETMPLKVADFDPDIIGYMQHFFSDYQDLYHDFMKLNRHCRDLMQLDRKADPQAYDHQLQTLLSGTDRASEDPILNALLSQEEYDGRS